jgi:hypothetical protein
MAAQGGADRGGRDPDAKAQQRLRLDQEAGPAGSGQHAADRGQQRAVGGLELGPWDLATEDAELVAQHHKLQVLGGVPAGKQHK